MLRTLSILLLCGLLAACPSSTDHAASQPVPARWLGSDVRNEQLGGDFTLTDHHGQPRSLSAFRGKVVVLVFGYTHCPDICPSSLFTYAEALAQLGDQAGEVQLLFVSVDPERDTPALLAQYVPAFNPTFIGLTATADETTAWQQVKHRYRIAAQKVPRSDGHYTVDHSAGSYLIDRQGIATVYEPHGQTATQLAHDLKILLE